MRKFRVQFLDSMKTSEQNCLDCIKELSKFIEILEYGTQLSFEAKYYTTQKSDPKETTESLELNQIAKVYCDKNFLNFILFIFTF